MTTALADWAQVGLTRARAAGIRRHPEVSRRHNPGRGSRSVPLVDDVLPVGQRVPFEACLAASIVIVEGEKDHDREGP